MKYLLIIGSLIFCQQGFTQLTIGANSPDINLADANGQMKRLFDLRGKVVLVDFWASWCTPCRRSNKDLVAIYNKYRSQGFEIFAVSLDEEKSAWKKAITADKITWSQVIEPGGWDAPVALKWKVDQLPTAYLLDKEGNIISINPDKKTLILQLEKLLK